VPLKVLSLEELSKGVEVTKSWTNLMVTAKYLFPYSTVTLRIVDGEPVEIVEVARKIRLDKGFELPFPLVVPNK